MADYQGIELTEACKVYDLLRKGAVNVTCCSRSTGQDYIFARATSFEVFPGGGKNLVSRGFIIVGSLGRGMAVRRPPALSPCRMPEYANLASHLSRSTQKPETITQITIRLPEAFHLLPKLRQSVAI